MLRLRSRFLNCFYCGRRSDTCFNPGTRQFECRYCDATNHLDENGEITNPPLATVNAGSPTIPQYAPKAPRPSIANSISPISPPPDPDSIFCEACLKHQRLFVASIAQYESEGNKDDFNLDKNYYRYRRNLVDRYPQCCDNCKPRVEAAIKKADYKAKTDYVRKMADRSRDPSRRVSTRWTGRDWMNVVGKTLWWSGLVLQLLWHTKAVPGIVLTSSDGLTDPEDDSWTTQGWTKASQGVKHLPPDEGLIFWSLMATVFSIWWNPKIVQVLSGFDRHLLGIKQWYAFQGLLVAMRFSLHSLSFDQQSRNAQLSAHILLILMAIGITTRATRVITTDTTPLFGDARAPEAPAPSLDPADATRQGFTFWKQQQTHEPSLAESLNDALPRPGDDARFAGVESNGSNAGYQFIAAPKAAPNFSEQAKDDMMEWQPTGSTTLPRALRNPNQGAGTRPFGQAPVQENNRPFWYRGPEAPTNPAKIARTSGKQPILWGSQRQQPNSFEPQHKRGQSLEFQQPKFFAQQAAPDREHDEQLAGLAGGLSFGEEGEGKKSGWFGFGKK